MHLARAETQIPKQCHFLAHVRRQVMHLVETALFAATKRRRPQQSHGSFAFGVRSSSELNYMRHASPTRRTDDMRPATSAN